MHVDELFLEAMPDGKSRAWPHVGYRIRAARKRRGWRQKMLAERIGVAPTSMAQIERRAEPSPATVRRVAHALGVTVASLVDPDDSISARHQAKRTTNGGEDG